MDAKERYSQQEMNALLEASAAVLKYQEFEKSARAIFDQCCKITGARSGYVALLSEDGSENEVLFLESGGLPCTVDPDLPMPIRGLRAESYRNNQVVFDNDFMNSDHIKYMPGGHVVLRNVMFSPLVLDGKTRGIIGLANKDGDFTDRDSRLAAAFGEFAAIALRNSRLLDRLNQTVHKLQTTLDEVKTLRGIIPICMYCKKVKDHKGYWDQVEAYIRDRSQAEFSHGVCPACEKKLNKELGGTGHTG
jgi:GAF domain-containing protein